MRPGRSAHLPDRDRRLTLRALRVLHVLGWAPMWLTPTPPGTNCCTRAERTDMPSHSSTYQRTRAGRSSSAVNPGHIITTADFVECFGQDLQALIDVKSWSASDDLTADYQQLKREVQQSLERETTMQRQLRDMLPELLTQPGAPPGAGWYQTTIEELAEIHSRILFPGGVEACVGIVGVHDMLPLSIHQLGVSMTSYRGSRMHRGQRLFRRELQLQHGDPVESLKTFLQQRGQPGELSRRDRLSQLARRSLRSYAERALLLKEAKAPWRMGKGNVAPLECLNGGGSPDLLIESIKVLRDLICEQRRFVFVSGGFEAEQIRTIGFALHPLQFAIIGTLEEWLEPALLSQSVGSAVTVDNRWDGVALSPDKWVLRFLNEVAPQVVYGVYRASLPAPPQVFFAHVEHAHVAAQIALADSVLTADRGSPQLIDLATQTAMGMYGNSMQELAQVAYARQAAPLRYDMDSET